jgi:hypothetical protein
VARDPSTADGGRPGPPISRRRHPAALTVLAALAALSLRVTDAAAAPAELPPWDPGGAQATPAVPAAPPASSPPATTAPATPPAATSPSASPPPSAASPSPASPADPAAPPPASYSDELPPPPRDPNDAAFMRPPNNQFQGLPPRTSPDIRRGWSARRRFAFTIAPAFAQFRLPFQGGRPPRLHGAGFNLELDVQIWRWIWLRGHGTYSGHPVDEARVMNSEMQVMETAPRGTIYATGFGAGPVFALDLGRFLPLIEVGLGGLRVASPRSEIKGQRGAACGDNRSCDVGLKCSAANVCEPSIIPDLYFGLAVDLLIRRHISLGAQFRYYSRLARGELTNFPVYLLGTIRLSVRF